MKKNPKKEEITLNTPAIPMNLDIMRHTVMDPMGSYTGRPADPYDIPVQDADDL